MFRRSWLLFALAAQAVRLVRGGSSSVFLAVVSVEVDGVAHSVYLDRADRAYRPVDERFHSLQLSRVDQRANFCFLQLWIADGQRGNVARHFFSKLGKQAVMHEKACSSETYLSGVSIHQCPGSGSQVNIGISQYDEGRFSSKFQTAGHKIFRCHFTYLSCCAHRSGE